MCVCIHVGMYGITHVGMCMYVGARAHGGLRLMCGITSIVLSPYSVRQSSHQTQSS